VATSPEDRVFILCSEPQILFLAERRSATRYIFLYPAMMNIPGARDRQKEIIAELQRHPPRVILLTDLQTSQLLHARTPPLLGDYVNGLIERDFDLVGLRREVDEQYRLLWNDAAREAFRKALSDFETNRDGPRIALRLYVRRADK
jgi:hypothetical protein